MALKAAGIELLGGVSGEADKAVVINGLICPKIISKFCPCIIGFMPVPFGTGINSLHKFPIYHHLYCVIIYKTQSVLAAIY